MKRGKKKAVKSMFGKEPFKMQAKKPEPDDRPRTPVRPASANRNVSQARRTHRLKGVVL